MLASRSGPAVSAMTRGGSGRSRSEGISTRMKIYQQGDLDNTCLLYSIANAYRALTGRRVDDGRTYGWSNIIKITPSISQFLTDGSEFFENKDKAEQMIHESIVRNAFEVLSTATYQFDFLKISNNKINTIDFSNSVVIFCITERAKCKFHRELDHWMVIIDRDETNFLLACSYTRFYRGGDYEEYMIQNSNRVYNNQISAEELDHVYPDYIYRISVSKG